MVKALSAQAGRTGIFSDFDGTLARIVDDPTQAEPVPGAVDALHALAGRYARVGVLSGRPAAFLRKHLDGGGLFLSGLYGMETVQDGEVRTVNEAGRWCPVVEALVARAQQEVAPGLLVEDKGLSLTVHYRQHPELQSDARTWAEGAAAATGLVLREARLSYELCPPVSRSKGTVLAEAAKDLSAVCFLGDDRGDLTAFDSLDALASDRATAVRIGVSSPEAPEELLDRADLIVDGPEQAVALLEELLR